VHNVLVRNITIGKGDPVDTVLADESVQVLLGIDGQTLGVERACQLRRINTFIDVGDLRRRESDNFIERIVSEADVEIVKISPGCTHNKDTFR